MRLKDFNDGDRVCLIKPFRCSGDDIETDKDFDRKLRKASIGDPEGTVEAVSDRWVSVRFDGYSSLLWVDVDCLEIIPDPTPEEIEAAISSIKEARHGAIRGR